MQKCFLLVELWGLQDSTAGQIHWLNIQSRQSVAVMTSSPGFTLDQGRTA